MLNKLLPELKVKYYKSKPGVKAYTRTTLQSTHVWALFHLNEP